MSLNLCPSSSLGPGQPPAIDLKLGEEGIAPRQDHNLAFADVLLDRPSQALCEIHRAKLGNINNFNPGNSDIFLCLLQDLLLLQVLLVMILIKYTEGLFGRAAEPIGDAPVPSRHDDEVLLPFGVEVPHKSAPRALAGDDAGRCVHADSANLDPKAVLVFDNTPAHHFLADLLAGALTTQAIQHVLLPSRHINPQSAR
eukprot:CAMPEP_0177300638 /NCGR_PEP_ID=MMETSP0368-20130122/4652_1 /TAXON_ID=447022 ORGANISM="Scrippsiella hangoei-like, Strain SHHI-4" /NCGR_SAMPLE_ID=MMETSP0368 /ASSEMBLY_ACC=CAM_ASM_000363 /LENGTH=197 /DNA_ID=CAMNT_0018759023 /DNA_START=562 /DNA_END=1156 /DNA_ORIENTATION=+